MYRIDELKKQNPHFNEGAAAQFKAYALRRAKELALSVNLPFKEKLFPNSNKYEVSKSMFDYLTRLTDLDVFDEKVMAPYIELVDKKEAEEIQQVRDAVNQKKSQGR